MTQHFSGYHTFLPVGGAHEGILRILHVCVLSRVQLFATPWTVACQAPLSKEFSRQEYWSGLPNPSPGDLSNPGIEPESLKSLQFSSGFFITSTTWKSPKHSKVIKLERGGAGAFCLS